MLLRPHDMLGAGRADVHFHLLPGVDDGPASLAETVELAELAVRDGSSTVVATPHVREIAPCELESRADEVRGALRAAGVALGVLTGSELAYHDVERTTDDDLARIAQGPPDARWLLLEAPLPDTHGEPAARGLVDHAPRVALRRGLRAPGAAAYAVRAGSSASSRDRLA